MSIFTDPKLGLIPGPFHKKLEEQNRAQNWYDWAGYAGPGVLDSVEFEYFALRNQASLFDISPMHKYRLTGPDTTAMLNRLVTRDVRKISVGRVGYAVWCDEEGMIIDDGTLFHLGDNDWRLCCQEQMLTWLLDAAWGFDVSVVDETHSVAGLSLQGPTSYAVLEAAGLDVSKLKPFDLAQIEHSLMISRTGFTGDLGYELWCDWDKAEALWDRIWKGGTHQGLRAIGYEAVNLARIEAGFLTAGVDFQPVHATERLHRGQTPFELGLGRLVDFNKGHFNGRRELLSKRENPRSLLLRFDVEGFKPSEGSLIYNRRKKEVGHITSGIWSPTAKRSIALAHVRMPDAGRSSGLKAEIYTLQEGKWRTRMARLTPVTKAFFAPPRARATPPART
ncbi:MULTISPECIES: aminomethyltransferase family protein [unclassified Ruegeria]|uniref:aminomethyltransferase family protein n=1 Tax=unclassified Ruegeria TaxID=2625375 RepID=UPI0014808309|nr:MULTISPECIES: aminomethyltransferase family protein [unclassified Ruegeria]NOD36144.1 aminomethyl transferase family protein [Ruegeria sp. HKCCD7296]NOD48474.1 aminomethyl transferase family protein [Ruegeria sp. HKCCD5849]NOD52494.1 aminomethyl transferase family protein [Ruegeria sp. HKCCD5851]NOD68597.1 aminomethyl transferase family protein [Ruegeria sp. HKCCD7303]NOE36309.1 aminomethyl transferase family protein [Ruegeria sp. HKCCD7318]